MQFYEENEGGQFVQQMAPQKCYHLSLGLLDIQTWQTEPTILYAPPAHPRYSDLCLTVLLHHKNHVGCLKKEHKLLESPKLNE